MTTMLMDSSVRSGLHRLTGWLAQYPELRVAYLHYADGCGAELCSPAGQYDALSGAAATAEALNHATIEVTDPPGKRVTYLTIHGTVADCEAAPLEITVEGSVYDGARTRLLSSLGVPPMPTRRAWPVTAAHLRSLLPTGGVR